MRVVLLITFLFITTLAFAQKEKKVYLNADGVELTKKQKSEAVAYEVRQYNRKKQLNGNVSKFNMQDVLLEQTEYKKGVKTGAYMQFNPAINIRVFGEYEAGKKTGAWAGIAMEGDKESIVFIEYYDKGELVNKADPEKIIGDGVMVVVETMASFPGGPAGWTNYLKRNLRYPAEAVKARVQGIVHVKFLVLSNGQVLAPSVVETSSTLLTNEAMRIVRMSPKWIPATVEGKPVDSFMQLKIAFRLR